MNKIGGANYAGFCSGGHIIIIVCYFRPTYCLEFLPVKSRSTIFCLLEVSVMFVKDLYIYIYYVSRISYVAVTIVMYVHT